MLITTINRSNRNLEIIFPERRLVSLFLLSLSLSFFLRKGGKILIENELGGCRYFRLCRRGQREERGKKRQEKKKEDKRVGEKERAKGTETKRQREDGTSKGARPKKK